MNGNCLCSSGSVFLLPKSVITLRACKLSNLWSWSLLIATPCPVLHHHYIVLASYPLNCHPTAKYVRAKHIFPGKLWPLCPSSFAGGKIVCWQEWYTGTLNISFAFPLLVNVKYWQLVKLLWSNGPGCTCWEVIYCRHKHFGPMPRLCDKFSSCQITLFSNHCTG